MVRAGVAAREDIDLIDPVTGVLTPLGPFGGHNLGCRVRS